MKFDNILVVFDPTREQQPALDRAAAIAEEAPSQLHLFACIHEEVTGTENAGEAREQQRGLLAAMDLRLEQATEPLLDRGIRVSTELEWDRDWYHAVVRASVRNAADVVLKSSYKHSAAQRVLKRTSDWTLIRECLCPVLLVKEGEQADPRKVLAAVDIRAKEGSYEDLNKQILDVSKRIMDANGAEVHFINAHKDLASFPDRNALMRACGTDSDRIHIRLGKPDDVIVEQAKELGVSMVVIGNSARTGISAAIRGNTAEKVLDQLDCDLLSMP